MSNWGLKLALMCFNVIDDIPFFSSFRFLLLLLLLGLMENSKENWWFS